MSPPAARIALRTVAAASTRRAIPAMPALIKASQATMVRAAAPQIARSSYSTVLSPLRQTIRTPGLLASTPAIRPSPVLSSLRHAQRRGEATAAAPDAASTTRASEPPEKLDWNTFFRLRRNRRRWQLLFSILMLAGASAGGAIMLANGVADSVVTQIPLEPFITLGLMVMGFGLLGWLAGPSLGSGVFYLLNRRWKGQMIVKENAFFTRIKQHRADPTGSSAGNPIPDYYGEKISSVAGYRQWLKDQRAFTKKRKVFV